MASRFFALLVWAAVAASVAFWGLRWLSRPTAVPANVTPVSLDAAVKGDLRRLLAGPAKPASGVESQSEASALAGRLKLLGVIAPRVDTDTSGIALLSMDGKPARAVRVGMAIDGDYVLRSLTQRGAGIGKPDGPVSVNLDLPLLPAPATGMLSTPPVLRSTTMPSVAAMQGGPQTPPSAAPGAPAAGAESAAPNNGFPPPPSLQPGQPGFGAPGTPISIPGMRPRGIPPGAAQGGAG